MYLYESHLGGFYMSDKYLDYDDLYCDECGDSDSFLGVFNNKKELKQLLKRYEDFYGKEYIASCMKDLLKELERKE